MDVHDPNPRPPQVKWERLVSGNMWEDLGSTASISTNCVEEASKMRPSHQLIGILPLLTMQNLHIWHVNEVTLGAEKAEAFFEKHHCTNMSQE